MVYFIIASEYSFFVEQKELLKKKAHLLHEYTIEDEATFTQAINDLGQNGFFDIPKQLVLFKRVAGELPLSNIIEAISFFEQQGHTVVLFEEEPHKEYALYIEKMQGTTITMPKQKESVVAVSPFAFTDFFLAKDKKNAWMSFSDLVSGSTEFLQIHAALFWALKTLYLVKHEPQATLDVKPYVYSKMKKLENIWSTHELESCIERLLFLNKEEQFDDEAMRMKFEQLIFSL